MSEAHKQASKTIEKGTSAPDPDDSRKPASPPELSKPSWKFTAKNALRQFSSDGCTDLAAGLTYFSVLALFPGLLAVISLLGLVGQKEQTTKALLDIIGQVAPGDAANQLRAPIESMTGASGSGFALVLGIVLAIWSASGYTGAFGRAMNRVYQVDEGRPFLKLKPLQLGITILAVIMCALVLLMLALSGPVAEAIGNTIGLGSQTVRVWNIAKWPVVLIVVIALVAVLYYFSPNVRQPKFRWMSLGAAIAILIWIIASLAFGFYVANFGNYNKTYGTLGGVIIFLLWVWLTNNALLFGAEIDSEIERARQLQAGMPAEETLQLPPRDTKGTEKKLEKTEAAIAEAREIREEAIANGADPSLSADDGSKNSEDAAKGPDDDGRRGSHSAGTRK